MPSDAKKGIGLVVFVALAGITAAFLAPVAIDPLAGDSTSSFNQSTTETVELKPGLNATLDSVDTAATPSTGTYTIAYDGSTASATVGSGENTTVTVGDIDVTIAPTEVGTGYAVTDYSYPTTAGWGGGAASLWLILPLIVVLGIFLMVIGKALDGF